MLTRAEQIHNLATLRQRLRAGVPIGMMVDVRDGDRYYRNQRILGVRHVGGAPSLYLCGDAGGYGWYRPQAVAL